MLPLRLVSISRQEITTFNAINVEKFKKWQVRNVVPHFPNRPIRTHELHNIIMQFEDTIFSN